MEILNKFVGLSNQPDLTSVLNSTVSKTGEELNCVRIGIIQEFYPEDLTVQVLIANKKVLGLNKDGSQRVRDYPPIYAKVCYCNPFETFPIEKGMECVLLFNDREIESWFINGDVNPQSYPRMHDLTDAIAIMGIRSLPHMIQILTDCLHLFYGNSDLQIKENNINLNTTSFNINANTIQNGDTTQSGTITATSLNATSAANGSIIDSNGKVLATVVNGIIKEIKE